MTNSRFDYCIIGAGPSGLTAAYKLLQGGSRVLLIERDERVGGLAKSYNYDGQIFDTGPKRFHTDDQVVLDFIHEITAGDIAPIGRSTKVHFCGQYFEWPLQSRELLKMPLGLSLRCAVDLVQKRPIDDPASFHQYIRSKYGEALYRTFFKPYTEKFLRWDVEDIHSDWASTGINRTVIDKRIKSNTLFDILSSLLLPEKIKTEFLYPTAGGFGGFYEKLLARCQAYDTFKLLVNDSVASLEVKSDGLAALTKNLVAATFGQLIWTGNLNDLSRLLSSDRRVNYLNTVFYNIICKEEGIGNRRAQWIYVSQGDSLVSRITCMKEFQSYTCKAGYYNVMCELTDSQAAPRYFLQPEKYTMGILQELVEMKFLKDTRYVEGVKVNSVMDTYPIYHRDYIRNFAAVAGAVKKFSPRIHLLGRSGAFWYNNSDHSIRFAIELSRKLLKNQAGDFNYREYFGGALGRAAHPQGQ